MNSLFDRFNLAPHERRLVVIVGVIFFAVINVLFIWPKFGEWSRAENRRLAALQTLEKYQREIARIPTYETRLKELESAGTDQVVDEQTVQLRLSDAVQKTATAHGIPVNRLTPQARSGFADENQFFDEKSLVLQTDTQTKELVDFMVSLAENPMMIRVKDLNLKPNRNLTSLSVTMTLTAAYQKQKSASKPPAPKVASNFP